MPDSSGNPGGAALAVANGGRATVYPGLPTIGLVASPGFVLLIVSLLMEGMTVERQRGRQTLEPIGEVPLQPESPSGRSGIS
jgi:hypothetical protein